MTERERIALLFETGGLPRDEYGRLIDERTPEDAEYLFEKARIRCRENFGDEVYLRAIIEFSNYCRSDCLYCGIRRSNPNADRYRMTGEEILGCAERAHSFGFRTVVLQSGEDLSYSDDDICAIVRAIRTEMPDMAVTLSIGEKSRASYQKYFDAGADRYLLRHESASPALYRRLHPSDQTLENRMRCLRDLKEIGFQTGAGMMLETPYQETEDLVQDLLYLKKLQPEMIGIGPFIPHKDTPFRHFPAGSAGLCLFMIGVLRLMFPKALIPATTALGTVDPKGREKGILAGANVIMPNVSPRENRGKYLLYDGKICTGEDAAMCSACMERRMKAIGRRISGERGDAPGWSRKGAEIMIFEYPAYYETFRCIGGACPDTCCAGWEVDLDEESADYYRTVDGPLGDRLRREMRPDGEGGTIFALTPENRCPFLNKENLCDIYSALGEESLCRVCTEYPRYYSEAGAYEQIDLSLSCPEMSRLFFADRGPVCYKKLDTGEIENEDPADVRKRGKILAFRDRSILRLQGNDPSDFPSSLRELADRLAGIRADAGAVFGCPMPSQADWALSRLLPLLGKLEVIDDRWTRALAGITEAAENQGGMAEFTRENEKDLAVFFTRLSVYFLFRYSLDAFAEGTYGQVMRLTGRSLKTLMLLCLAGWSGNGKKFGEKEMADAAHLFSREVEHSEENVALLRGI